MRSAADQCFENTLYVCMYVRIYRWGDNRSPAFGELSDSHFFRPVEGSKEDRLAMWGQVRTYTNQQLLYIPSLFSVICCINICINIRIA